MTNPDREELVNLADRLAALPTFKLEIVTTVPGVALNAAERDLIVTALRRLAEEGTQEAVKGACHRIALEHFDYYSEKHRAAVMAGNNAVYQAMSIGMSASEKIAKAIDALETSAPPAPSAAVPAIYICYDGFGDCFISRERPERHVAIVYDEDLAEEIVDYLNHAAPPQDDVREALAAVTVDLISTADKDEDPLEWASVKQAYAALGIHRGAALRGNQSDGGVEGHAGENDTPATKRQANQSETTVGIKPGPSDPTSLRPEVSVEELAINLQDIVDEIRSQNWKCGGVHLHDGEEAARILARALLTKYRVEGRE